MADVKIILTAVDNASRVLGNVAQAGKKTEISLKDGFSNAAKVSGVFGGALIAAGVSVKSIADETADYTRLIRDLSSALGISAEETSRIVQAADDWGIEINTVSTALRMMTKNGIAPSIDSLADMADKFVSIEDPTARAAEMSKVFGRQWSTLVPLLKNGGQALRDQASAISDGLVVTDKAIQDAREYEIALDNLNDQVQEVRYSIGRELIPVLTDLLTPAQEKAIDLTQIITREVDDQTRAYIRSGQILVDVTEKYDAIIKNALNYGGAIDWARQKQMEYNDTLQSTPAALDGIADATEQVDTKMAGLQMMISGQLGPELEELKDTQGELRDKATELIKKIGEMESKKYLTGEQKSELAELRDEYAQVQAEIKLTADAGDEATKRILFGILQQQAAIDGVTTQAEQEALNQIAVEWGLIDQATANAMIAADLFFASLGEDVNLSKAEIGELTRRLLGLPDSHTFHVYVRLHDDNGVLGGQWGGSGRAAGGPVAANTPYLVGERGPEIFVPKSAGDIISNRDALGSGGTPVGGTVIYAPNINVLGGGNPLDTAAAVMRRFKMAAASQRAGINYAGAF